MRSTIHRNFRGIWNMLIFVFFSIAANANPVMAPGLQGAWQLDTKEIDGKYTHVLLFSGAYFTWTTHETETGAFIMTRGGSWKKTGKKLELMYEFHTIDSTKVGTKEVMKLSQKGNVTRFKGKGLPKGDWKGLDQGVASPLTGAWLFSGRERDGKMSRRSTDLPRKTMKILTGSRFQWIAYNTETKRFFGTGGGEYVANDGKYTENIRFFSRDVSRVGVKLGFKFDVKEKEWHHSGKSSKGDPMYEIWSKRK